MGCRGPRVAVSATGSCSSPYGGRDYRDPAPIRRFQHPCEFTVLFGGHIHDDEPWHPDSGGRDDARRRAGRGAGLAAQSPRLPGRSYRIRPRPGLQPGRQGPGQRRARTRRSSSGISPQANAQRLWKGTQTRWTPWRSAPTARRWPAAARMRRSSSGTSPAARTRRPCKGIKNGSWPWRSARTARRWLREATTRHQAVGRGDRQGTGHPPGHADFVRSVAFSPDGKTLASGRLRRDDQAVGRGDRQGTSPPQGTHNATTRLWCSARTARRWPREAGDEPDITLWDVAAGKSIVATRRAMTPTASRPWPSAPDGKTLASGISTMDDQAVGRGHRQEHGCSGAARVLFRPQPFSPDGKTLATGGVDKTIRLWDVGTAAGTDR